MGLLLIVIQLVIFKQATSLTDLAYVTLDSYTAVYTKIVKHLFIVV